MKLTLLEKEISKRFIPKSSNNNLPQSTVKNINSLDIPGFKHLYQASFYEYTLEKYRKEPKDFYPKYCCVCGQPQTTTKEVYYSNGFFKKKSVFTLPFCTEHAIQKPHAFIASKGQITPFLVMHFYISESLSFLTSLLDNFNEKPPWPWEVFPNTEAESSAWRQGDAEQWINVEWRPYWSSLNIEQRKAKLELSEVSESWRNRLLYEF